LDLVQPVLSWRHGPQPQHRSWAVAALGVLVLAVGLAAAAFALIK
jgi:hypothetical protein